MNFRSEEFSWTNDSFLKISFTFRSSSRVSYNFHKREEILSRSDEIEWNGRGGVDGELYYNRVRVEVEFEVER